MLLTQSTNVILRPFALILGYILQGIFWFLGIFMEYPNVGVAIILLTIIIYVLMIPLTVKQQKFSKLSNKMNPEIQAIQAKYKDKKDQESMARMNQEMQNVYAKYGVNPSGSCIQLLIQLPILYALYRVIYNMPAYVSRIKDVFYPLVTELEKKVGTSGFTTFLSKFSSYSYYQKQVTSDQFGQVSETTQNTLIDILNRSSSADWVRLTDRYPDLAHLVTNAEGTGTLDQLEKFNTFLGLNIANSPKFTIQTQMAGDKNYFVIIGVLMIPILAALTQWINTKLMPQPQNNSADSENSMAQSMKMMNTIMPLMSAFFCFQFPIGMGIYWIAGAVVRCVIQICVNKHLDSIDIDEMIKKNVEKNNERRRKAGLPPQQINSNATISTRNVETKKEKTAEDKAKIAQGIKDSTEYYNKNAEKPGSLASKAAMVKQYNEKNNKK